MWQITPCLGTLLKLLIRKYAIKWRLIMKCCNKEVSNWFTDCGFIWLRFSYYLSKIIYIKVYSCWVFRILTQEEKKGLDLKVAVNIWSFWNRMWTVCLWNSGINRWWIHPEIQKLNIRLYNESTGTQSAGKIISTVFQNCDSWVSVTQIYNPLKYV
jgi:hypothetical protein